MTSNLDATVIIIGSGFSGIGAAIKLKELGYDFLILERENDLGGTWRDNRYPGIAVDITSFTYSYSFEQNPNWSRLFPEGDELYQYANFCVDKYDLRQHFIFNANVAKAQYNETKHTWTVYLNNKKTYTCNLLISANGALTDPKYPDIEGIDSFKGEKIHTARWNNDIELQDKNIAVIGTGATSVQLVPTIAPYTKNLYVYQRTPIWIFPKPDTEIPTYLKQLFKLVPQSLYSLRTVSDTITQTIMVTAVVQYKQYPFLIKALERYCLSVLKKQVNDKHIQEKLIPKYGFGCKRPSFSNDYYPTFNRKNVHLITDGIERITEHSIITKDGKEQAIDVLITATGFNVAKNSSYINYELHGRKNHELNEFWSKNRLQAYMGCAIPNYPNFFIIFGPYAASGLSWFDMIEIQLTHITRVLKEMKQRGAKEVEVTTKAHQEHFDFILSKQSNTVFYNNNCQSANSYYFDKFGDAPFLRPLSVAASMQMSKTSDLNDYNYL